MNEGLRARSSGEAVKHSRWPILAYALLVFALCWPAWLNGQAFFLQDTTAYIKGAASGVELISDSSTAQEWLHPSLPASVATSQLGSTVEHDGTHSQDYSSSPDKKGVLAGRSIYYGMYLFLITAIASLNAVPIITSMLTVLTIASVSRSVGLTHVQTLVLLVILAASKIPHEITHVHVANLIAEQETNVINQIRVFSII